MKVRQPQAVRTTDAQSGLVGDRAKLVLQALTIATRGLGESGADDQRRFDPARRRLAKRVWHRRAGMMTTARSTTSGRSLTDG